VFTPQDADGLKKTARTFPITTFYDVEQAITSLGIGEALVTVLSTRGVPTPLAATRLIPPDSLMGALDPVQFQGRIATSALSAKYGQTIDRQSAHEIIGARIAAAQQAALQGAAYPAAGGSTGAPPAVLLDPAQQQREIQRQARALEQQRQAAERAAREQAREQAAAERERKTEDRARQRSIDGAIRTGGRIVTSRTGQSLIRGVFGTLFGGKG
jgi:hypothetical protein